MDDYYKAAFWQVAIDTPKDSAAAIEDFFLRAGAQSTFELLYAEGKTANLTEDNTQLYFFFAYDFPVRAFVPMALAALGLGDLEFQITEVKYADYLKEFERTFRAFALTEKTALIPPWDAENPAFAAYEKKLWLIPGMAFGTGKHATTQLMVEFIEEIVVPSDTVIDLGCGSGILAIAALLWGAEKALGIDVESLAVESARENCKLNRQKYQKNFQAEFMHGDFSVLASLPFAREHTVFIANILPNIFETNSTALQYALTHCRAWALSGIPAAQHTPFTAFLRTIWPGDVTVRQKEDWLLYCFVE